MGREFREKSSLTAGGLEWVKKSLNMSRFNWLMFSGLETLILILEMPRPVTFSAHSQLLHENSKTNVE